MMPPFVASLGRWVLVPKSPSGPFSLLGIEHLFDVSILALTQVIVKWFILITMM